LPLDKPSSAYLPRALAAADHEAFAGDIINLHSRMLEPITHLNDARGAGSTT
jgi:F0F1-type ATP synthase alpha subunit